MVKKSVVLMLAAAATALPQAGSPEPGGRELGGGPRAAMRLLGAEPGRPDRVVTGAPYSADAVTETTQALADGNTIHQTTTTHIYRDSQGRTRREPALNALSSAAPGTTLPSLAFINDPVAGFSYVLDLTNHTATKRTLPTPPPGGPGNGPRRGLANSANTTTESLGRQLISGVPADGTRITVTIPAGQIGNAQSIQIVTENWYSPDLQIRVMSKRTDPRSGESVFQLNNLSRAEPPSTLFVVPADFQIVQQMRGMGMGMRRRGAPPQ